MLARHPSYLIQLENKLPAHGTLCLTGRPGSCKPKALNNKKFAAESSVVLESASGQIAHGDKFFPNCDNSIFYKGPIRVPSIHGSSSCSCPPPSWSGFRADRHTRGVQFFEWCCLSQAGRARGSPENVCLAQLSATTGNMESWSLV